MNISSNTHYGPFKGPGPSLGGQKYQNLKVTNPKILLHYTIFHKMWIIFKKKFWPKKNFWVLNLGSNSQNWPFLDHFSGFKTANKIF